MSEGSGIHPAVKPESQTVAKCSELREKQQKNLYEKMDNQHNTTMVAIGGLDKKMSFMEGAASAKPATNNEIKKNGNGKRDWGDVFIRFLIAWGPFIAFLIIWGLISWLKSKNVM